jgi:hypothetical protein
MGEDTGPWQDGQRAWERLAQWSRDARSAPPAQQNAGDRALDALADIRQVRWALEHAELEAVRAGRRLGKSWAEIATSLGVARQSAWERWRDVDESASGRPAAPNPRDDAPGIESAAADESAGWMPAGSAAVEEVVSEAARQWRRRSLVLVPDVVGMSWDDARMALRGKELVGVAPDPEDSPLSAWAGTDGVVSDQSPEAGARVPQGSAVTLWLGGGRGGGGSGVREPRRPTPDPKAVRALRDEVTDETVA